MLEPHWPRKASTRENPWVAWKRPLRIDIWEKLSYKYVWYARLLR